MRNPMNRFVARCFTLLVIVAVVNLATAGEIKLEKTKEGVTVNVDGKLFTKYVEKSGAKPILFPVLGPTGKEMTRQYPMRDALKTERDDHIHHRSLWFTHGDVNGVSFWHENNAHGHIIHTGYGKVESGDTAIIETTADWVGPDKKRVCQDKRRMVFGAGDGSRWIDFEITIVASDGDVKFGDTKEGCFGVRTAGTMKVDSKLGGKIINSRGDTDKGSWGQASGVGRLHGPCRRRDSRDRHADSSFQFPLSILLARSHVWPVRSQPVRPEPFQRQRERRFAHDQVG
jgi:hypothetical protein